MPSPPHVILIPFMAQGHLIPMVDIAKLLAWRNVIVTIVTTPLNAARFKTSINRAIQSGLRIHVFELHFPATEAGLPEGCECADVLPYYSQNLVRNFFNAASMLQQPIELLFEELKPSPSCMISDKHLPWTADIASKFRIPRLLFDGQSCFSLLCSYNLQISNAHKTVSESEAFLVPGLPDRIEFTRAQLPNAFNPGAHLELKDIRDHIRETEEGAYGVLVNSFEELEPEYVKECRKAKGDKVWCIGPVSLCNAEDLDKAQRGNISSIDENQCLKWLDSWPPGSVIYACLGSLSNIAPPQLIELGLGLEASNRPFVWVLRGGYKKEEIEQWIVEDGFEERVKERGLLIRGWAPQVLILSHPAIGGFLTHCGWNSTLEGICAGVPMVTWPLFAEQFYNEKLVVQVLDVGVGVGAAFVVHLGEEEKFGVSVKREKIREAIDKVTSQGKEGEGRRQKARKLAEMAKRAVEGGGSSYLNISLLVEDIMKQARDYQIKA